MTSELIQNLLAEESNCRVVFLKLREARDHLEVECNKALHTLQMAKRKLYKAGFQGNIMRDADGNRLMKLPASDTAECTRAVPDVPDVPELVRYGLVLTLRGVPDIEVHHSGELVLHSQAAAIIEAKDKEIEQAKKEVNTLLVSYVREHFFENKTFQPLDSLIGQISQLDNAITITRDFKNRAEAAEAELAQIKAQVPAFYLWQHPDHENEFVSADSDCKLTDYNKEYGWSDTPLFAAPIDQTAEIERLREALREVHTMIEHDRTGRFKMVQNVINAALSEKDPS